MSNIVARYKVQTAPLRSDRRIELLVLFFILVLCLQLLYSGARVMLLTHPEATVPAEDALALKNMRVRGAVTEQQSAEILSRPLFWQGRRPLEGSGVMANVKPGAKRAKLQGVNLLGTFGGEMAGVIVRVKGEQRRLMLGEEVDGWILDSVDANTAIFSSGESQETFELRHATVVAGAGTIDDDGAGIASDQAASPNGVVPAPEVAPAPKGGYTEDDLSLGGSSRK